MSRWNARLYCEPPTKRLTKTEYDRPQTTITDTLQNDEAMLEKLEGYEEVDILERVEFNTHVRYITLKDGRPRFCLGGLLKRVFDKYVVLSNGQLTWSVQREFFNQQGEVIFKTKFFKYMSKDKINSIVIESQEDELQKLKEENDRLKQELTQKATPVKKPAASTSAGPRFF